MHPITIKQMQYLVALDETKNYRKAANLCGISQPSLSIQLQNLEAALDVRLVERSRSGVFFTPIGREVLARAKDILARVQGLRDAAEAGKHALSGTIKLGTKSTLGPYILPKTVQALHHDFPDLKLYIRECGPREMERELAQGDHDIILTQFPINHEQLTTTELFRERLLLAHARDHRFASMDYIRPSDLKDELVLSLDQRYHMHEQIRYLCDDFSAVVSDEYLGTSLDALRQMVGMGMGIAFLPELYAKSEISENSEVIVRPLNSRNMFRTIGLASRKDIAKFEAYEKIADVIRHVAKDISAS